MMKLKLTETFMGFMLRLDIYYVKPILQNNFNLLGLLI